MAFCFHLYLYIFFPAKTIMKPRAVPCSRILLWLKNFTLEDEHKLYKGRSIRSGRGGKISRRFPQLFFLLPKAPQQGHVLPPTHSFCCGLSLYTCHSTPSSSSFPNHYLHVLQAIRYLFQSIYSVFQPTKTLSIPLTQLQNNFQSFFSFFFLASFFSRVIHPHHR